MAEINQLLFFVHIQVERENIGLTSFVFCILLHSNQTVENLLMTTRKTVNVIILSL